MQFCIENDGFCIQNDGFCIENVDISEDLRCLNTLAGACSH